MNTSTPFNYSTTNMVDWSKAMFNKNSKVLSSFLMDYGNVNILGNHLTRVAKDMYEFILKKPHWEGERNAACCLNLPKKFVDQIGIDRQTYLKVTYNNDQQKLIVEKLVQ